MINVLYVGSVSACFELENNLPYYCENEYTVTLDGTEVLTANTNVFSLFSLVFSLSINLYMHPRHSTAYILYGNPGFI